MCCGWIARFDYQFLLLGNEFSLGMVRNYFNYFSLFLEVAFNIHLFI